MSQKLGGVWEMEYFKAVNLLRFINLSKINGNVINEASRGAGAQTVM